MLLYTFILILFKTFLILPSTKKKNLTKRTLFPLKISANSIILFTTTTCHWFSRKIVSLPSINLHKIEILARSACNYSQRIKCVRVSRTCRWIIPCFVEYFHSVRNHKHSQSVHLACPFIDARSSSWPRSVSRVPFSPFLLDTSWKKADGRL